MAPNSVRTLDVAGDDSLPFAETRAATTLAELIATVPQVWRPVASEYLTKVYRLAQKLANVQTTLAQYERHTAEGSFPPPIRNSIKDPKVQFSKEFLGTTSGSAAQGLLDAAVVAARKSLLSVATAQKKAELAELQKLTSFDSEEWRKRILESAERAAISFGVKVTGNASRDATPVWTGSVADAITTECNALWKGGNVYHYRALGIARSAAERTLLDRVKTMTIKADTDIVMRDADSEKSTREVVRDEMAAQLRALETRLSKTLGQSRKSGTKPKGKGAGSNASKVNKRKPKAKSGKGKNQGR